METLHTSPKNPQIDKKTSLLAKTKNRKTLLAPIKTQEKMPNYTKLCLDMARWREFKFEISDFSQLAEDLNSNERIKQFRGIIGIRRFLSVENPIIQPVLDANLIPKLIHFLHMDHEPEIQMEAAWVLTNVASGTTTQLRNVIDKGAVPGFVKILKSKNKDLREQAIWAFGNICGDSATYRDNVLKHGGNTPLLKTINNPEADQNTIIRGTWALSNMCRGRPLPAISYTAPSIPTLCWIMLTQTNEEPLTDAAWALSYLSRASAQIDTLVCNFDFLQKLLKLIETSPLTLIIPCARIISSITQGTSQQKQVLFNFSNFLSTIYNLLCHYKRGIRREGCEILSNITNDSEEFVSKILQTVSLVPKLIELTQDSSIDVRQSVMCIISNILKNGNHHVLKSAYEEKILGPFMDAFFDDTDNKESLLIPRLEALENFIEFGKTLASENQSQKNPIHKEVIEGELVQNLGEHLENTLNKRVYNKIIHVMQTYFPTIDLPYRSSFDSFDSDQYIADDDSDL